MSNMSYCRFYNTLRDLQDCYEHLDEELSGDEYISRKRLVEVCQDIIKEVDSLGGVEELRRDSDDEEEN
jgi:hypothetical protein